MCLVSINMQGYTFCIGVTVPAPCFCEKDGKKNLSRAQKCTINGLLSHGTSLLFCKALSYGSWGISQPILKRYQTYLFPNVDLKLSEAGFYIHLVAISPSSYLPSHSPFIS